MGYNEPTALIIFVCVCVWLPAKKITQNWFGNYVFPVFFICCSVRFPCNLQHFGAGNCSFNGIATFWNFRIETLGSQENLICLCSSSFFNKETRYWVALNVYQKKHNWCALCDSDIYGPLVAKPTKHRVNKKALSLMSGSLKFGTYTQTDSWET